MCHITLKSSTFAQDDFLNLYYIHMRKTVSLADIILTDQYNLTNLDED
jgi:hypothetical protein